MPIGCAVNARTGRELTLGAADHHTIPHASGHARRLLVIGAGPAGAAAAIEAARAGDDVTLVEREPEIGGQLRLAGLAPAHTELWERYLRSTTARLRAAGVTLQLDTEADAELADGYDAVVLASGARPYLPTLPATDLSSSRPGTPSGHRRTSPVPSSSPTGAAGGTAWTPPSAWPAPAAR